MRKNIGIGIGAATAVIALTAGAGAALASSGGDQQAAPAFAASVSRHITTAQAAGIAKAMVSHSRVIEIESDDLHNSPVWKVKLASPHGMVIVDVNKRTGKGTIVGRDSGGRDDRSDRSGSDSARDAREDARDDRGDVRREDRMEDRRDDGRHGGDDRGGEHRGGDDRGGSGHG